jgi:biopolymer transport protein TolR
MAMSSGSGQGVMGEINVTPLVDVMLVLLIIFMVTAPLMNAGVDIDLPKEQAPPTSMEPNQLLLKIDKNHNYFIQDNQFTAEEMPAKLKGIAEANPDQAVFLLADGSVPYNEVAFLLAAAKSAGIPRVGLVFEPGAAE